MDFKEDRYEVNFSEDEFSTQISCDTQTTTTTTTTNPDSLL
jgi:hypothetical protein